MMVCWKSLEPKSALPPPEAMPVAAAAQHRGAGAGRLAGAVGYGHDLAGIDVDDAGGDGHVGLGVGVAEAAEAEAAPVAAATAKVGLLGLIAELGDAAHDDGVHAQQLADLGGAGGIGAIGVGEVLLGHDLVQGLALDDGVGAVLHQAGHQQVGDAFADVHVGAEHGGGVAVCTVA